MKFLLRALVGLFILAQFAFALDVKELKIMKDKDVYRDNDIVRVQLPGMSSDETIVRVQVMKQNRLGSPNVNAEVLDVEDFSRFGSDQLEIPLSFLDNYDKWVTFVVQTDKSLYTFGNQSVDVQSVTKEKSVLRGASATYTISDVSGSTFTTGDQASASGTGFDASEGITNEFFQELDGSLALLGSTAPGSGGFTVDASGNLSGTATRNGSAFNASTVYIRYTLYGLVSTGTKVSSNNLAAAETDPPDFISARTLTTTTIEVTFNENVTTPGTNSAAIDNWSVSGNTVTGLTPLGSTGTTVCTLTVSTALGRGDTPDVTFTAGTNEYEDAAGNDAISSSAITPTDGIVPGSVTLFITDDNNQLSVGDFIGSSSAVTLIAHVAEAVGDGTLDGVIFEGSDDGSAWTAIGTDGTGATYTGNGDSLTFSVSWDVTSTANQYKMLRARAFDNGGTADTYDGTENSTLSSTIGSATDGVNQNFEDSYRVVITNITPTSIDAGSERTAVTYQMQNNYGNPRNTFQFTSYFGFTDDTSTETWYEDASGPTELNSYVDGNSGITYGQDALLAGDSVATVYYANSTAGSASISVTQVNGGELLFDGTDTYGTSITINAGTFDHYEVALSVAGDKDVDNSFNITVTAKDAGNNTITSHTATDIDIFTNATAAPDGTNPTIGGDSSPTPRFLDSTGVFLFDVAPSFSNGVATISCTLPHAESDIWISAEANDGAYNGSRDYGTGLFNVTVGAVADFLFNGTPTGGNELEAIAFNNDGDTYTITAVDQYENVLTAFASDVTLAISGTNTPDIAGLSGAGADVVAGASFSSGVADISSLIVTATVGNASGNYTITSSSPIVSTGSLVVPVSRRSATVSNQTPANNAHVNALSTPGDLTLSASISLDEETALSDDYQIFYQFSNDPTDVFTPTASGNLTYSGGGISYTIPGATIASNSSFSYLNWFVANNASGSDWTLLTGDEVRSTVINPTVVISPYSGNGDISGGGFAANAEEGAVAFTVATSETNATVTWTTLYFQLDGSYLVSDITAMKLYLDDGTTAGQLDGSDTQIGSTTTFSQASYTAEIALSSPQTITTSPQSYILSVQTSATASGTRTLRVFIQDLSTNFTFTNAFVNAGDQTNYVRSYPSGAIGMTTDVSLPVELLSFQAAENSYQKVKLNWSTASEINNAGFWLYRSETPTGFTAQPLNSSMIQGRGSVNEQTDYEYVDDAVEVEKTYYYKLVSVDLDGTVHNLGVVSGMALKAPNTFALKQNYPNPFNPGTKFSFQVPKSGTVSLIVYNALGQEVKRILDHRFLEVGVYDGEFTWDGTNNYGASVPTGIYFFRLISHDYNFSKTMKMVLMK